MAWLAGFGAEGDWIRSRFDTEWKSKRSYTDAQMDERVAWGNTDFTPPNNTAWVRFRIRHEFSERASLGPDPLHRYDGTVVVEVFVPRGEGEGTIDDLVDDVADIYRDNRDQQGLRFYTPRTVLIGEEGAWYRKNVLIPFQRDTVHT